MIWKQGHNEKRDYQQPIFGDTIASATWTIIPDSTPSKLGTPINLPGSTTVRVSGLAAATDYALLPHIVGASGQEFEPEEAYTIRAT